jgi:hypothetical protein
MSENLNPNPFRGLEEWLLKEVCSRADPNMRGHHGPEEALIARKTSDPDLPRDGHRSAEADQRNKPSLKIAAVDFMARGV